MTLKIGMLVKDSGENVCAYFDKKDAVFIENKQDYPELAKQLGDMAVFNLSTTKAESGEQIQVCEYIPLESLNVCKFSAIVKELIRTQCDGVMTLCDWLIDTDTDRRVVAGPASRKAVAAFYPKSGVYSLFLDLQFFYCENLDLVLPSGSKVSRLIYAAAFNSTREDAARNADNYLFDIGIVNKAKLELQLIPLKYKPQLISLFDELIADIRITR